MSGSKSERLADEYEALYPNTGCEQNQKQERMERIKFKEERRSLRRTVRNRGIVVPDIPWTRGQP